MVSYECGAQRWGSILCSPGIEIFKSETTPLGVLGHPCIPHRTSARRFRRSRQQELDQVAACRSVSSAFSRTLAECSLPFLAASTSYRAQSCFSTRAALASRATMSLDTSADSSSCAFCLSRASVPSPASLFRVVPPRFLFSFFFSFLATETPLSAFVFSRLQRTRRGINEALELVREELGRGHAAEPPSLAVTT